MQILGIVGSMRRNKNTQILVENCLNSAKETGQNVQTELVHILDVNIGPCKACYEECARTPYECVIKDDLQPLMSKMLKADAVILASPKYFPIPSKMVAFMERFVCLAFSTEMRHPDAKHVLADKPCGLIAVTGGDNVIPVLQTLEDFALSLRMNVVMLKNFPYRGVGGKARVEEDEDLKPVENAKILGRKLVEAAKK